MALVGDGLLISNVDRYTFHVCFLRRFARLRYSFTLCRFAVPLARVMFSNTCVLCERRRHWVVTCQQGSLMIGQLFEVALSVNQSMTTKLFNGWHPKVPWCANQSATRSLLLICRRFTVTSLALCTLSGERRRLTCGVVK